MTIKQRRKGAVCYSEFHLENQVHRFSFNGKRGMPLITSKREAREYEVTLKEQLRKGTFLQESPVQNFARFYEEIFLAYSRKYKSGLGAEFDGYYGQRLMEEFGKLKLSQISPGMIERFLLKLSETKTQFDREYSPVTIRMYYERLKRVFNHARRERIFMGDNPCRDISPEVLKQFPTWQPRKRWLNQHDEKEESRLFSELSPTLSPLCRIILNTGMRPPKEILLVEKDHVNLSNKPKKYKVGGEYILIPPQSIFVLHGKNGTRRVLPLNSTAQKILSLLCDDVATGKWLFSEDGEKPVKSIKRGFQGACERAEIENLRPYDLRHTFATRLLERNTHTLIISALLGHSTPLQGFGFASRVTPGYAHATWDGMRRAVDSLEFPPEENQFSPKSGQIQEIEAQIQGLEERQKVG